MVPAEPEFKPYPSRSRREVMIAGLEPGQPAWIAGRVIPAAGGGLIAADASAAVPIVLAPAAAGVGAAAVAERVRPGCIADLLGTLRDGAFHAEAAVLLAEGCPSPGVGSANARLWSSGEAPFARWNLVKETVRAFFTCRGFLEVETPVLLPAGGQEPHLDPFRTRVATRNGEREAFLITSPEYCLKRLLAAGHEKIFEMARVFRNGPEEGAGLHWYEFTMLEWYRAYACYLEIMEDLEALVARLAEAAGSPILPRLRTPFRRATVTEAFAELAGVDLSPILSGEPERFAAAEAESGAFGLEARDSAEVRFFKVLIAGVEPALERLGPVFLVDYPAAHAALAKTEEANPAVAERFELYIDGVEVANGFTELNDPAEQRRRFQQEAASKAAAGGMGVPVDEAFLDALALGMPPAGGVAVGLTRLAAVLWGERTLDAFLPFGRPW